MKHNFFFTSTVSCLVKTAFRHGSLNYYELLGWMVSSRFIDLLTKINCVQNVRIHILPECVLIEITSTSVYVKQLQIKTGHWMTETQIGYCMFFLNNF